MIETLQQTKDAIAEIQVLTGWTTQKVATKVGVNRVTVDNAINDRTVNPSESFMAKLTTELTRVREIHGNSDSSIESQADVG